MRLIYLSAILALLMLIPGAYAQQAFCCGSYEGYPVFHEYGSSWDNYMVCNMNCWYGCYPCDLTEYGYSCEGYYGYHYSCNEDSDDSEENLDVSFDSDCEGNTVEVDGGGNAAHVVVKDSSNNIIAAGDTSSGKFTFSGCDLDDMTIKATKTGSAPTTITESSVSCSSCGVQNETGCEVDADCLSNQKCVSGECVSVQCECGKVENHQCVPYACCSDSQCKADELCQSHTCVKKPQYECTSDAQCAADKYCDIPTGAAGGACKPVTGQCGKVENHAFVPYGYECGSEEGCPSCGSGFSCVEHKCVQNDISCPTTGIVGDKKTCEAKENEQPCTNCDYVVTDPAGKNFTGRTDENGNFDLPLNMQGTYKVALMKDGAVVKVIEVKAFPQAQPEEPTKPAATGPDLGAMLALVVLLLLLVLGIVYWRSRGSKK